MNCLYVTRPAVEANVCSIAVQLQTVPVQFSNPEEVVETGNVTGPYIQRSVHVEVMQGCANGDSTAVSGCDE